MHYGFGEFEAQMREPVSGRLRKSTVNGEVAHSCHGKCKMMMVLVVVLGPWPHQAAGRAQPHRGRWALLLSLLNH